MERAAELDVIAAAIASACAGAGSVLLVEGAAGIGKTRLLAQACEQAAGAGMTVLTARAAEYEDGYAWGVVRQLFEQELRFFRRDAGGRGHAGRRWRLLRRRDHGRRTPSRSCTGCTG